jgi:arsenate reductase
MNEYLDQRFDYVITVCDRAAEVCPVFPGDPERIHWSFADPAAVEGTDVVKIAAFQATLREMRQRISLFMQVALKAVPSRP